MKKTGLLIIFLFIFSSLEAQNVSFSAQYHRGYLSNVKNWGNGFSLSLAYLIDDKIGLELSGGQTSFANFQNDLQKGLENQLFQSWDFRLGIMPKNLVLGKFRCNVKGGIALRKTTEFVPLAVYFEKVPNKSSLSDWIKIADNQYVLEYEINKENVIGWYIATDVKYYIGKKIGCNVSLNYENFSKLYVFSTNMGLFLDL